jgi:hypothetical protein
MIRLNYSVHKKESSKLLGQLRFELEHPDGSQDQRLRVEKLCREIKELKTDTQ